MDAVNRTAGGGARAGNVPSPPRAPWSISGARLRALRALDRLRGDDARGRLGRALRAEELAGLVFAFRARTVAAAAVALWLLVLVPAPRSFYYLGAVAAFFLLGLIPHLLRRHPFAVPIKLAFVALDVALIVAVIIIPPPTGDLGWPIQMRLRFHEFIYLLLLLAGAALSYSPLNVLWTGFCVVVIWSIGFLAVYSRPDTLTFAEATAGLATVPPEVSLRIVLSPTYVGISQLWNQVVLTAIITGLLAAAVWRARETLRRQSRAEVARADLARYVSPDVADAMMASPGHRFGEPATRNVAVLFADIVGFTGLAETLPPERVVALLASFHTRTCAIVFRHGGTLDKFLGDGLMATFGALADDRDAPRRAVACAFEMQAEVDRWCAKRAGRGASEVRVAIGVHCGPVVVGNIGAERRLEFTVIGDAVNVANRLERLTRELGCRIALSRECLEAADGPDPDLFEAKGSIGLRGRAEPVEVFTWPKGAAAPPSGDAVPASVHAAPP